MDPEDYYDVMRGHLTSDQLFQRHPLEAAIAHAEAWHATLGEISEDALDDRIARARGRTDEWVLIGGPPCQAYSLVGRSRNKGIDGYRPEEDHRHFLYREYLRIVARHEPAIFVMENVKGLLSSRVAGQPMFDLIREDLTRPGRRIRGTNRDLEYVVLPFGLNTTSADQVEPSDFILRMEDLGIPQARHRVILLGVRRDVASRLQRTHVLQREPVPSSAVLDGLPRLSGRVSRNPDPEAWIDLVRRIPKSAWFKELKRLNLEDVQEEVLESVKRTAISSNQSGGEFIPTLVDSAYARNWYLDPRIEGISNHSVRTHMDTDLERYFFASCFARVRDRSPDLGAFPPRCFRHTRTPAAPLRKGRFSATASACR